MGFLSYFFELKIDQKLFIRLGFLFQTTCKIKTTMKLSKIKISEIKYYFQKNRMKKYSIQVYKNSFIQNNNIKKNILKRFLEFLQEETHISYSMVRKFIKTQIYFVKNYDNDFSMGTKIITPCSYKQSLPYWLTWFSQLSDKNLYIQSLELNFLYTFNFKKNEDTIIQQISS